MKFSNAAVCSFALCVILSGCGSNGDADSGKAGDTKAAAPKSGPSLIDHAEKPTGTAFERKEFFPGATLELPSGGDWKTEGNKIINGANGYIIVLQSQAGDMLGVEKDYLKSYNDVNIRDAEGWKHGDETLGEVNGVKAARTEGTFNNGTDMVTRDYVFFTPGYTAIIQCRVPAKDKGLLAPMADYIAGSCKRQ